MSAHKKPKHLLKSKFIKIRVTESQYENFRVRKNRLSSSSPTLSASEVLRKCIALIDDKALLQFLELDKNDSIRIKLMNDYLMSNLNITKGK